MQRSVMILALAISVNAPAFAQTAAPAGAQACTGCHGAPGLALPSLEGLKAGDIAAAMAAFRAGSREATVMDRISRGFSEPETQAIADWFASRGSKP